MGPALGILTDSLDGINSALIEGHSFTVQSSRLRVIGRKVAFLFDQDTLGWANLRAHAGDLRVLDASSRRSSLPPFCFRASLSQVPRSSSMAALIAFSAQLKQINPPWSHISKASRDHSFGVIPSPPARGSSLPRPLNVELRTLEASIQVRRFTFKMRTMHGHRIAPAPVPLQDQRSVIS